MKILVLGGSGFIGRNLVNSIRDDFDVTILDSEDTDFEKKIIKDVRGVDFDSLVKSFDLVIDLIALANPKLYLDKPFETFEICFMENYRVAQACSNQKKRLIQFSTSEIYGDHGFSQSNWSEDDTSFITGPIRESRWIYSTSKQMLERLLFSMGENGMNYTVIRPFNFIGHDIDYLPSIKSGCPRVFCHFLDAIKFNKRIKLVNGGEQMRAYTFIDDAIDCIIRIINNPDLCCRQIFNIGSPSNEVKIKDLAEKMCDIALDNKWVNEKPIIESVSGEEFYGQGYADISRRVPCIKKASNLLGWTPKTNLDQLLKQSMQPWFIS
tara:strand:- start:2465 stop:3433 length:969 start_codon:yes stop_codon:yes gene_type:complete